MKTILKFTTLLLLTWLICSQIHQNLYTLLQISEDATSQEIKKAFRKLSIKYHPDRNTGDIANEKYYLEIQRAFEILMDVSKRNTYDLWGEEGLKKIQEKPKPKGGDYRPQMPITLELFYTGGQQVFSFRRGEICKHCKGTGDQGGAVKTCPLCQGTGKMIREVKVKDKLKTVQMKCKICKGLGIGSTAKCPHCRGQKITMKPRDLRFVVEKGMADGDKVMFKGQSQQGFEFYPGDVIVTLRQMGHNTFQRDGNNLKMSLTISLKQAIIGFEKTINHLDGHAVNIVGDYNIQNGEELRLKGQGMPIRGQMGQYGDLLVKINIRFPKKYTEQQLDSIRQICGESNSNNDTDL